MNLDPPGPPSPAGGDEAPLDMLAACHVRIEQQCAALQRLVPHVVVHGADALAREAAAGVMRCFDTAAALHHADEEADLFPALIESMAGSDAVCLRELTAGLAAEHRELESRWRPVREALAQVAAGAAATPDGGAVAAFVGLCRRHIAREERELLPMAARLLGDDLLDRVGRAMRERRGIVQVWPASALQKHPTLHGHSMTIRSMTTPLIEILGLAHIGIRVHDLERSVRFYELLGFTKAAGPIGPEPVAILEHPSGLEVNLVLNAASPSGPNVLMDLPEKHPGITHFALLCPDILAAKERLEAAGIALSGGPVRFGPAAQGIFVRDPDRNVIELHQRG